MPTYRNIGSETLVVGAQTQFKPLEEKAIDFYVADQPKLKLVSEDPIPSPIEYSETLSAGGVFDVLGHLGTDTNLLKITAKTAASVVVSFNSKGGPKATVNLGCPLAIRPLSRISKVFVHEGSAAVELWNNYNFWG